MTGALEVKVKELRAFTNELANRFDEKSRLASLVPFFGGWFVALGRCVRQASRPRRIASMPFEFASTGAAGAKGLSRALISNLSASPKS